MEEINYAAVLPIEPPEGTLERAMQRGAFKHQRLIYRADRYYDPMEDASKKAVRVTCTGCGETWLAAYAANNGCWRAGASAPFGFFIGSEPIISGTSCLCPECGAEAKALHIGNMRYSVTDEHWVMTAGLYEDKLVLFGWMLQRETYKDGSVTFRTEPWEAYVIEKKKIVRLMGYVRNMSSVSVFHKWEQRKQYLDCWGCAELEDFDPEILTGSTAENSALKEYLDAAGEKAYPVSYLKAWQKHPQLENLIRQGAGELITEMLDRTQRRYSYERPHGAPTLDGINFKEKRPAAMLGLSKPDFRYLMQEKATEWELIVFKELIAAEKVQSAEALRLIRSVGRTDVHAFLNKTPKERGGFGVLRCLRYCEKQQRDTSYLMDYWRMAAQLGENVDSERFPKDLRAAHDRVMRALDEIRNKEALEKKRKEIEARAPMFHRNWKRMQRFAWEKDGICIRPAENEEELYDEHLQQDHCVNTYGAKVARGESMIFFIRHTETPEKSWYTLELSKDGRVLQNRGHKNCDRTEEIEQFEKEWLAWMAQQKPAGKTKSKKEKAA